MKNFRVRIWNGRKREMIYPSESFRWTISLCGEVFRDCGVSIKDRERCKILLSTGIDCAEGNEIFEGDVVFNGESGIPSVIVFDGGFKYENYFGADDLDGRFLSKDDVDKYELRVVDCVFNNESMKYIRKLF